MTTTYTYKGVSYFQPQTATPASLPNLGLCPVCEDSIRIRANGTLFKHTHRGNVCTGTGRTPAAALPPTFKRWLHAQYRRNDANTNPLTRAAENGFGNCRYGGHTVHFADVDWTTPEELHGLVHNRAGVYRDPDRADGCTHDCDELADAIAAYEVLIGTAESA